LHADQANGATRAEVNSDGAARAEANSADAAEDNSANAKAEYREAAAAAAAEADAECARAEVALEAARHEQNRVSILIQPVASILKISEGAAEIQGQVGRTTITIAIRRLLARC
jgi:hypothetical protein